MTNLSRFENACREVEKEIGHSVVSSLRASDAIIPIEESEVIED